jgi:hypothetical protein
LPEMGDDEEAMLSEAFYVKSNSRLGCQIQSLKFRRFRTGVGSRKLIKKVMHRGFFIVKILAATGLFALQIMNRLFLMGVIRLAPRVPYP